MESSYTILIKSLNKEKTVSELRLKVDKEKGLEFGTL